jgi:hypothetical protein
MDGMGILDNLENAWDEEFLFESKPVIDKDAMGREKFWEDLGRPDDSNLLIENCSSGCTCGK